MSAHWTGDCWKVLFDIIDNAHLELIVVSVDHGIGIVSFKGEKPADLNLKRLQDEKTFEYFLDNVSKIEVVDSSTFFNH
jgi:hypothetical protein